MQLQVERRPHPRGEDGTSLSLEEVAKRAAEGRLDPRTRAWSIEKIVQAGDPKGVVDRSKVLLDALRRERIYIEDPTDSDFMPSAACLLKGCAGLKFLGEDCDGLLIAWLAACGSIGIFGAVVGHSYDDKTGQLSHVLGAVWDGNSRWYKADPSTKQPFGTVSAPAREKWVAVHDGRVLCDKINGCDPMTVEAPMSRMRAYSDFVGVVGAPSSGTLGQDDVQVKTLNAEMDETSATRQQIAADQEDLRKTVYESSLEHEKLLLLREYFNKPIVDMDVVQQQSGLVQEPSLDPDEIWSQEEENNYQRLRRASLLTLQYGQEAINGKRRIARLTDTKDIVLLGNAGEEFVQQDDGNIVTGVINVGPQPQSGQLGIAQWVVVAVVVGGVLWNLAVGYAVYSVVHEGMALYRVHLQTVQLKELSNLYQARRKAGDTHEQALSAVNGISGAVERQAKINLDGEEKSPMNKLLGTIETIMWAGLGIGVLVAGGYALINVMPLLKVRKTVEA